MKSSIVICTKDREEDLRKALRSIATQSILPDEVVVVDSGKDEELVNRLTMEIPPKIRFCYVRSDPGLTLQRNIGIKNSTGDVLMFIDDDVVLEPEYVESVLTAFAQDKDGIIGAVQGRITNAEPHSAGSCISRAFRRSMSRLFLLSDQGKGRLKASGFPSFTYRSDEPGFVECLAGGCMSFRRSVFEKICFDEALVGYGCWEDVDIARQLLRAGYRIYYAPSARLAHYPSSNSRSSASEVAAMRMINHHYLYRKHSDGSLLQKTAFAWSMLGLLLMHMSKGVRKEGIGALKGLIKVLTGRNPLVKGVSRQSNNRA
jgi:GT2 family glycosyltransferase